MDSVDQSDSPESRQTAENLLSFDLLETLPPPVPAATQAETCEAPPLSSEEELLRDLFPEEAHSLSTAAPNSSPQTEANKADDAGTVAIEPHAVSPDPKGMQTSPRIESSTEELSSEAYISLRSLEGLEELEDVHPSLPPTVHRHTEAVPGGQTDQNVQHSPTEQKLLQLTRSVEQLTAIVFQLNGTIQVLSQGLQAGGTRPPDASAAPTNSGFAADPGYRASASIEVAPQVAARRRWEPAPPPAPRETPEQWSERLEKFFDAPLPTPTESPGEKVSQDFSRKLACDVLNALNSHNMKSLEVRVEGGGVIVLKGRVISEHLRYLATVVAQRTPGCQKVVNELTISEEADPSSIFGRYWKHRTRGQKRLHLVAVVALLALSVGGYWAKEWLRPSVVPATGVVEIEGQPVDGARLVLHPVLAPGQSPRDVRYPTAVTDGQGKFDFTTFKPHDGIPPGEYHVSIEWRRLVEVDEEIAPGPNLLPQHYLDPEASGIHVKIARDTRALPPITLKW